MPINKAINLTDEERLDVRFEMTRNNVPADSKAEGYETEEGYLQRIDADDSDLKRFHQQRDDADAESWKPFYDVCRQLSTQDRTAVAMQVIKLATKEGIDLTPLQPLIDRLKG